MRAPSIFGLMLAVTGLLVTNTSVAQFNPFQTYEGPMRVRPGPASERFRDDQQLFDFIAAETI
jgi:hypothetical protein